MNGYVQDERYIAGEHMDVRRDCVSFALHHMDVQREASRGSHKCLVRFKLSSGGAGARIDLPGHAQAHPVALDTRLPASYGPGKSIPTPASAMSVLVLFESIAV